MLQRIIIIVVLLLAAAQARAAVPQRMSLQGYLTDRIGSPIEASQSVTFAIYTVPVGGLPVWQETQSVAFSNGLFSVTLGTVAAFPPDLFDVPLWLGTTIGTDNEMEPRRALTTAGFSFRAEDSDALQGRSAAELDQAGHVDDLANPHEITTGQIGAATSGDLATHAGNTTNPHLVTAGQTGATHVAVFERHTTDQAGHHLRYADAEAVSAMGVQATANPLNHERYTDTESFAAVLAADGEASGLDSDLVDGLQAIEIINAAATVAAGPQYQFVGFSTDPVLTNSGLLGMTNACKATYGPTAKFATTRDVLETTIFTPQTGRAWVQHVIIAAGGTSVYDVTGMSTDAGRASCSGWRDNSNDIDAFIITDNIGFFRASCDSVDIKAACSAPTTEVIR